MLRSITVLRIFSCIGGVDSFSIYFGVLNPRLDLCSSSHLSYNIEISQQPRLKLMNIIIIESMLARSAHWGSGVGGQSLGAQTNGQPLNQEEFIAAHPHCPIV